MSWENSTWGRREDRQDCYAAQHKPTEVLDSLSGLPYNSNGNTNYVKSIHHKIIYFFFFFLKRQEISPNWRVWEELPQGGAEWGCW